MEMFLEYVATLPGLFLVIIITALLIHQIKKTSSTKFPPGPYPLPLLGSIYKHGVNPAADILADLAKEYGAVYCIFIGPQRILILNSYDSIREAMTRPSEFSHRGLKDKYTWRHIRTDKMHGLFSRDYDNELIRDRNITITILRKLGIGKTVIEDKILEEIATVETMLKENKYSNLRDLIHTSIGNVMVHILLNKRLSHNDPKALALLKDTDNFIKNIVSTTVIDGFPSLRFIQPFKGTLERFISGSFGMVEFMKEHSMPLLEKFDPKCNNESFVESFFDNKYDAEREKVDLDMEVFKYILGDLVTGGTETSATGVRWTILMLANRQDIQEKLYNEIKANTNDNEPVRNSDKERLPYLEAVMWEIQRYCTLSPFILHKSCDNDAELFGYTIPKNTMILLNVLSTHMDEKTWGDPHVFRPERFINDDGKFVKHPHVIPFSIGKRACPGEILARQELYLFTGNLIKRFRFYPPEGQQKLDEEPVKDSIWCPKPFDVKIIVR